MRNIIAFLGFLLLGACSTPVADHHAPPANPPAKIVLNKHAGPASAEMAKLDAQGEQGLALLKQWYDNDVADCVGLARPAYLCSGVMLRATSTSYNYFPWDPSPSAERLGGTSVSWVRRDQTFAASFTNNGFFFYPRDEAPADKMQIDVLCMYPTNAGTTERSSQGCGAHRDHPEITAPCLDLGVLTAALWLERYAEEGRYRVCGWNLRPEAGIISQWFRESLKAHQDPSYSQWEIFNEMMVKTWQSGTGASLPLIGFYYVGNPGAEMSGRTKAWFDQMRYFEEYGQLLPIFRMDMPLVISQPVTFAYSAADQWFEVGSPTAPADFEDVPTGRTQSVVSHGLHVELTGATSRIHDDRLDTPLISGHYATSRARVSFAVQHKGPVRITFNWGCNSLCYANESIGGEEHMLNSEDAEGEWRFGTFSTVVRGPETIEVYVYEGELALDNIEVLPVDDPRAPSPRG